MNNPIKSLTRREWCLWLASLAVVLIANQITPELDPLTMTAALVGVTSLVFAAKGNVWSQVLMIVFSILYGVIGHLNRKKIAISGKIQSDAQYIVTLPSALKYVYMAMFLLGIALFFIFLAFKVSGNESVTMGHLYFALVFATIGFLVTLWASRWSIVVTGASMEIYGLLHKKAELSMQDVGKVEIGKKDAMILYDTAGRKLITVDGLAENYDCLAKSLEENGKM